MAESPHPPLSDDLQLYSLYHTRSVTSNIPTRHGTASTTTSSRRITTKSKNLDASSNEIFRVLHARALIFVFKHNHRHACTHWRVLMHVIRAIIADVSPCRCRTCNYVKYDLWSRCVQVNRWFVRCSGVHYLPSAPKWTDRYGHVIILLQKYLGPIGVWWNVESEYTKRI